MPPQWMSTRVLPAGYCDVEVKMTGPNAQHPPGFHFAVNDDDVGAVGAAVGTWIGTGADAFKANIHTDYTVDRLIFRTSAQTAEVGYSTPGTMIGADLLTPAVAALIKLRTLTPGRRGGGRMYWPGVLGDGDVDNAGVIDAPTLTRLQDCCDYLETTMTAASLDLVILHSYRWAYALPRVDPGPPAGFPAPSVVTDVAPQQIVATQRRRQR